MYVTPGDDSLAKGTGDGEFDTPTDDELPYYRSTSGSSDYASTEPESDRGFCYTLPDRA